MPDMPDSPDSPDSDVPTYFKPGEAAALLEVDPKTLYRYGTDGKIGWRYTPGGQRRYYAADVIALANATAHRNG